MRLKMGALVLALAFTAIDLDYKTGRRTDEFGNVFRYRARVEFDRGDKAPRQRWAFDVLLRHLNAYQPNVSTALQ